MKTSVFCPIFFTLLMSKVIHARHRKGVVLPLEEESDVLMPTTFWDTPTKYVFRRGQLAKLQCSLSDLGTKKVIWRRKSDPNPLTIGRKTFVDDRRISVEHKPLGPHWHLLIKQVRLDDAGQYECQVSSKNRELRRYVTLEVQRRKRPRQGQSKSSDINSKEIIMIHGETYVEKDQKLVLTCNATGNGHSPDDLDWFRNGQKLGTDLDKKVRIEERVSLTESTIISRLTVASVEMEDAGIYVCRTSDLQIAATRVDVLNAGTNNVKRGTEKDSSGKYKDGRKSDSDSWRDKNPNSARHLLPSFFTTYSLLFLSTLALKIYQVEIFSPT